MVGRDNKEKNKMNPILWFLFAIVIPVIIVITLAVIIMGVAGFNVIDWAKEKGNTIPVISDWITTEEEKTVQENNERVQAVNEEKDEEITMLNETISDLEATIDQLEQEILKLEENETTATATTGAENPEENQEDEALKMITKSYEEMDSEQAALILESLDTDTALNIVRGLSNEVRGDIMQAMEPESAAQFTELLLENEQ